LQPKQLVSGRFTVATVSSTVALLLLAVTLQAQASTTLRPSSPALREVTDETGRTIRIPEDVHRIVSLAPSLTETIYALGLEDRLVGDTDYCDFPPEARKKPKVGGALNPSLEAIAALHPDLVLVTKSFNRLETVEALETLGIPSYATDPHTVDAIVASTQRIAGVLGAPVAGSALAKDLEQRIAAIHEHIAALPRRRVLFIVWTEPLISIGKDTFIADALQHAGAVSVVDSSQSWPQVNLEEVVRLQPEFLVFAESHSQATLNTPAALENLPGWRILDAVRNHRFAVVSDAVNRPAPRIVSAIDDLARQLHPEAFTQTPASDSDKTDKPNPPPPSAPQIPPSRELTGLNPFHREDCSCVR
jgi:iron complex transport system substrate-binding protein